MTNIIKERKLAKEWENAWSLNKADAKPCRLAHESLFNNLDHYVNVGPPSENVKKSMTEVIEKCPSRVVNSAIKRLKWRFDLQGEALKRVLPDEHEKFKDWINSLKKL